MTNTIDTSATFDELKNQARDAITLAGKSYLSLTKTVGLYRAALTLKSPHYDEDDTAKASSHAYNLIEKWLIQAGMPKAQARVTASNSKSPSVLAEKVLTLGLSEEIYNAMPTDKCCKAAKAVTKETVGNLNKIKLSKAGRLSKSAKANFGITDEVKPAFDPPKPFVSLEGQSDEEFFDDKELFDCLIRIEKIKQTASSSLCESSRIELKSAVLDLLTSLTPAIA
jgi:hypothetical protein